MLLYRSRLVVLIGSGVLLSHMDFGLRIPLPALVGVCGIASRLSQLILSLLRFRILLDRRDIKLFLLLLVVDGFCDRNVLSRNVFCDDLRPISV